jgi:hypothetical protein
MLIQAVRSRCRRRRFAAVAKQPRGELVPVVLGFNYDVLEAKVAEQVRSSADRIRERVKKTVEDIIEVGNDLLAVKEAEAGEEITVATSKEIVAEAKKKRRPRRQKAVPADKRGVRLIKMLRRYQERWPGELSELARHLLEFADPLEKPERGGKKKARS